MWQMLSRVREKSFRLQPESSNTIARPDALDIASSVVSRSDLGRMVVMGRPLCPSAAGRDGYPNSGN